MNSGLSGGRGSLSLPVHGRYGDLRALRACANAFKEYLRRLAGITSWFYGLIQSSSPFSLLLACPLQPVSPRGIFDAQRRRSERSFDAAAF